MESVKRKNRHVIQLPQSREKHPTDKSSKEEQQGEKLRKGCSKENYKGLTKQRRGITRQYTKQGSLTSSEEEEG